MKPVLVFLCASALPGAPLFRLVNLSDVSEYPVVRAFDINDAGQIAGASLFGSPFTASIYSGGRVTLIGTLPGDAWSMGYRINAHGEVIGESFLSDSRGFRYADGRIESIVDATGNPLGPAVDINDHGDLVGALKTEAYLYSEGVFTNIGALLPFESSTALAVNNSRTVVGTGYRVSGADWQLRAFAYSQGAGVVDLGALFPEDRISVPQAINGPGDILGYRCRIDISVCTPFLISDGKLSALPKLAGDPKGGYGATQLNDAGAIVGFFLDPDPRAVLWTDGAAYDLKTLVRGADDWKLPYATSINNKGQIVGWGYHKGEECGFLLEPIDDIGVPEPSTFVPLSLMAVVLLLRRQRLRRREAR